MIVVESLSQSEVPLPPEGHTIGSSVVRIEATAIDGTPIKEFDLPIVLILKYTADDLSAARNDPGNFAIGHYDEGTASWVNLGGQADEEKMSISTTVSHLSIFGLLITTEAGAPIFPWWWLAISMMGLAVVALILIQLEVTSIGV